MTPRLFAALAVAATLVAGCSETSPGSPFAPGVNYSRASVDQMTVGKRLLAAGQHELALEAFGRVLLERGAYDGEIYAGMGAANFGLGRLGQAEIQLRRAVEFPDALPETWANLGMLLLDKGETSEAVAMLQRGYALSNGENDAIRDNLRKALARMGERPYDPTEEEDFRVVRSGRSTYEIRQTP